MNICAENRCLLVRRVLIMRDRVRKLQKMLQNYEKYNKNMGKKMNIIIPANLIFNKRCILLGMHFLLHASLISLTNIIHIYVLMDKLLAVDNAVAASSG